MRPVALLWMVSLGCAHAPGWAPQAPARQGAFGAFAAAAALGASGAVFAVQSNAARGELNPLPTGQTKATGVTQAQAFDAYQRATSDARAATALLLCAAGAGGVGAYLWWRGAPATVAVTPAGVAVSGTFP